MSYQQPKINKLWESSNLEYEAYILDNGKICSGTGRTTPAHASGGICVTLQEFLDGSIQELVKHTLGIKVLEEALNEARTLLHGAHNPKHNEP